MKTVYEAVKEVLDKIIDETTEHFQKTDVMQKKASGGKKSPSRSYSKEREVENGSCPKSVGRQDRETIQKHWSHSVVFTDAWTWGTDTEGQKCPEEELQQGELWAVAFRVGCYIVRGARRIYRMCDYGYNPENEVPADKEEIELIKKDIETGYRRRHSGSLNDSGNLCRMVDGPYGIGSFSLNHELREKLRDTLEISARHISNPGSEYTYICRAASARNFSWAETIKSIYTVKENGKLPDEYASLLVRMCYVGDAFSSDTWYKLEPTGKITTLTAGLYGIMDDDKRFS